MKDLFLTILFGLLLGLAQLFGMDKSDDEYYPS